MSGEAAAYYALAADFVVRRKIVQVAEPPVHRQNKARRRVGYGPVSRGTDVIPDAGRVHHLGAGRQDFPGGGSRVRIQPSVFIQGDKTIRRYKTDADHVRAQVGGRHSRESERLGAARCDVVFPAQPKSRGRLLPAKIRSARGPVLEPAPAATHFTPSLACGAKNVNVCARSLSFVSQPVSGLKSKSRNRDWPVPLSHTISLRTSSAPNAAASPPGSFKVTEAGVSRVRRGPSATTPSGDCRRYITG